MPADFTPEGLPLGAQLLGQANSEPRLLALGAPAGGRALLARATALKSR